MVCTTMSGRTFPASSMNTIDEHILKDQSEIEAAKAIGNDGKVRHLEEELILSYS